MQATNKLEEMKRNVDRLDLYLNNTVKNSVFKKRKHSGHKSQKRHGEAKGV